MKWNGVTAMTDEQWKEIEKKLVPPFGRVELEIDGYKVAIVPYPEAMRGFKRNLSAIKRMKER